MFEEIPASRPGHLLSLWPVHFSHRFSLLITVRPFSALALTAEIMSDSDLKMRELARAQELAEAPRRQVAPRVSESQTDRI